MPRRERRKCSVCAKTGHNKRTCPVFRKQQKNQPDIPVVLDTIEQEDHTILESRPTPKKQRPTKKGPVRIAVSTDLAPSPHVVDLKDHDREDLLKRVEVFRESYQKIETAPVDFASMIREHKAKVCRVKKTPAFTAAMLGMEVPKPEKREKPRRSFSVPKLRLPRLSFPTISLPRFEMPQLQFRPMALGAAMLAFLIAIPFPALGYIAEVQEDSAKIMAISTRGFAALQASTLATFTADIDGAATNLNEALGAFSEATELLETEHTLLQSVASVLPVIGSHISGRQEILTAGHHMALGNTYLVKGIETARANASSSLTERLDIVGSHLDSAVTQYDAALTAFASVPDGAIPKEYRTEAAEFELLFGTFVDDMYDVLDLVEVLQLMLGEDGYRKYLVMFQNNHELRPTGGFMGSFATVEVQKGSINWDIPGGGTYDVQGQLTLNYEPPLPLQLMNNKWELQDANWWSHVPASAAVIEEMYENSRLSTVDGVIFVNATVLSDVLSAIGPIVNEETGTSLEAADVLAYINDRKEIDGEATNKPKQVLTDLVPSILAATESGGQDALMRLLLVFTNALNERDVQLFAHNDLVQTELRSYGWTGEVREIDPLQDYLHIVRTNLQGQKTDANIDETVLLDTEFMPDGRIVNTLTITRTHTGEVRGPLYEGTNISYIRSYVPAGSTLISAEGFQYPPEDAFKVPSRFSLEHPLAARLASVAEIERESGTHVYREFNKEVFANWMIVPPGESRTVTIVYELPFRSYELGADLAGPYTPYTMLHQKQSGMQADVVHTITFDQAAEIHWQSHAQIETGGNFALYKSEYERDMYYGIILQDMPNPVL